MLRRFQALFAGLSVLLSLAMVTAPTDDHEESRPFLVEGGTRAELAGQLRGQALVSADSMLGWHRILVPGTGPAGDIAARLSDLLGRRVVPELRYDLLGPESEPEFGDQWALENIGQFGGVPGADIQARQAWSTTTGSPDVVVAVVDSGVDLNHPDLTANIWANPGEVPGNGIDDDGNGFIDDANGWDFQSGDNSPAPGIGEFHATWVAGVIAAAVNGNLIAGAAPTSSLMVIRSCASSGCFSGTVAAGIEYAVDNGAHIINLSLGVVATGDPPVEDAIDYAQSQSVLVVAAAGNDGEDIDQAGQMVIPAGLTNPNIVAVASSFIDDTRSPFSNYGATSVDVAAPGEGILTTRVGGSSEFVDGTSFAAPFVAGAAALLLTVNRDLSPQALVDLIIGTARPAPDFSGMVRSDGVLDAGALTEAWIGTGLSRFVDTNDSTFEADIRWLAAERITIGCNPPVNDVFCPDDPVTRGQMAAFLVRALNPPSTSQDFFTDDNNSIFENDVNRLAAAGITKGCNPPANTRYCPNGPVSRGQMAAFLHRAYQELLTPGAPVEFVDDNSSTFEADIEWLGATGVTKGCNPPANDRYCPNDTVTRGQMAAFLHRADG
ncbi:MAG: S8 family serine peptidase [Acidimicrobiia bacterium]|nr:S8 family serine peptidase [Acidimicrobiia bacterium]